MLVKSVNLPIPNITKINQSSVSYDRNSLNAERNGQLNRDVFEIRNPQNITTPMTKRNILMDSFDSIMKAEKRFSIEDYKKLSRREKDFYRKICNYIDSDISRITNENIILAESIKNDLDEKYGKNNYVFISLGTSPAAIGRYLELNGIETKYLPLSELKFANENEIAKKEKYNNYKKFLDSQNLTKEIIDSSDKKYVVFDFANTGRSMQVFERLMKEVFDLDSDNIEYKLIRRCICPRNICDEIITNHLFHCEIEPYTGIPHLPFHEIEKINEISDTDKYCSRTSNMFSFMLMDYLAKKGKIK